MNLHLTGRLCASISNVSIRWHYSHERPGGWPTGLLGRLGMPELQAKWPQEVLPLGERRLLQLQTRAAAAGGCCLD